MQDKTGPQFNSRFSVLLEHEAGVMEVFLVEVAEKAGSVLRAVGSISRSGTLRSTDPQQVVEAIELLQWSRENQCVFDGQTSPEIESAN